ncbi:hypothetical protein ATK74_0842 [Propionicimonas paludicola]|uniref:Uncharacterized protein n=1 Tax=Propionicimonas paludicola TaxID=185243 RepID=A0A2A9CPN8_9ACTN|nr:hypothetical protein [Propionicimonas paludicola]PFG16308.1 hypothetical protein ATK74_0842 [Propionicimonas paludicola]
MLTVTEANAVNKVLRELVSVPQAADKGLIEAAVLLAEHAHQRLGAGLTKAEVRAALTVRVCAGCGCTDDNACVTREGPCWWINDDLCSACARLAVGS